MRLEIRNAIGTAAADESTWWINLVCCGRVYVRNHLGLRRSLRHDRRCCFVSSSWDSLTESLRIVLVAVMSSSLPIIDVHRGCCRLGRRFVCPRRDKSSGDADPPPRVRKAASAELAYSFFALLAYSFFSPAQEIQKAFLCDNRDLLVAVGLPWSFVGSCRKKFSIAVKSSCLAVKKLYVVSRIFCTRVAVKSSRLP